jgi:ribosome maturation factor RimP
MREALLRLLSGEVEALGYELIELEVQSHRGGGLLRLYIDRPGSMGPEGITVEDCAAVSRRVSAVMDAADTIKDEYTLEVSSPGFDRPLRTREHFERFVGGRVHVESVLPRDGRRRWTGQLMAVDEQSVVLEVDGQRVDLELGAIKTARLVPEFGMRRE